MMIFRDEDGNPVRNEDYYGFIKHVKATLRRVKDGEVLETLDLQRKVDGAPPEIAPSERAYAYWGTFTQRGFLYWDRFNVN